MPRIRQYRQKYMLNDIGAWVAGRMMRQRKTQSVVADEMGISQQALSLKIRNNQFTYGDLLKLFKILNAEDSEILKLMKV